MRLGPPSSALHAGARSISAASSGASRRTRFGARMAFWVLSVSALTSALALAQPSAEQARIEYLIESVAALNGARFIRNGAEFNSREAADHLRVKLRNAGSRVRTAEDFILYCATGSSMSGETYRIRLADGRTVNTADFLRGKLAAYEEHSEPSN
jgi:hypothetical protein